MTSLRGAAIQVGVSTIAKLALNLAPIPILIHGLGIEAYGGYVVLTAVAGFSSIGQLGIGPATTFRLSSIDGYRPETTIATSLVLIATLASAVSLALVLLVPALHLAFFKGNSGTDSFIALYATCALVPSQFMRYWILAIGAGYSRFDLQAFSEVSGALILSTGLVGLSLMSYGLDALILWTLLSTAITILIHGFILRRDVHWTVNLSAFDRTEATKLIRYGTAHWIATVGQTLFGQVDRLVVGRIIGLEAAGIYGAATQVASKINVISGAPAQVIVPDISRLKAAGDNEGAKDTFTKSTTMVNVVALLLSTVVIFSAPFIAAVALPDAEQQKELSYALGVLALAYGAFSMAAPGYFGALGIGKPALSAKWVLISGVVFIIALMGFATRFGLRGAAWSNLAFMLVLMMSVTVAKELGIGVGTMVKKFLEICGLLTIAFLISRLLIASDSGSVLTGVVTIFVSIGSLVVVLRNDRRLFLRSFQK